PSRSAPDCRLRTGIYGLAGWGRAFPCAAGDVPQGITDTKNIAQTEKCKRAAAKIKTDANRLYCLYFGFGCFHHSGNVKWNGVVIYQHCECPDLLAVCAR